MNFIDRFLLYIEENKTKVIVTSICLVLFIVLTTLGVIYIANTKYEKELDALNKVRYKVTDQVEEKKTEKDFGIDVVDSEITAKEADVMSRFTQDESYKHIETLFSVNDEETRLNALDSLPLNDSAKKSFLKNKLDKEIYDGYSYNIKNVALDYSDSSSQYSAIGIGKIEGVNSEGQNVNKTVVIRISYNLNRIVDWEWS